jgi:triosephosphate isomerase
MRKKIIAANWKMNMTLGETEAFFEAFLRDLGEDRRVEVVIVPPFTALPKTGEILRDVQNIKLGAQNMHWEKPGAYTGEICAEMLRELYVHYVVVGHSERRTLFGETDDIVNKKARAALKHSLRPIVCIGETLAEREANKVETVLSTQVQGSLAGLSGEDMEETVIAYEPVWAIGTGKVATPAQAQAAHAFIRAELAKHWGADVAGKVRIQYGGSVKPGNAAELMAQHDIDGALVGGASLDPRGFAEIVKATRALQK